MNGKLIERANSSCGNSSTNRGYQSSAGYKNAHSIKIRRSLQSVAASSADDKIKIGSQSSLARLNADVIFEFIYFLWHYSP